MELQGLLEESKSISGMALAVPKKDEKGVVSQRKFCVTTNYSMLTIKTPHISECLAMKKAAEECERRKAKKYASHHYPWFFFRSFGAWSSQFGASSTNFISLP